MNIIVGSEKDMVANMVRGALKQMNVQNTNVLHSATVEAMASVTGMASTENPEAVVCLVDWEMEPALGEKFVAAAHQKNPTAPILLLCPKARSATTYAGMKAGAKGVVTKPINPEELLRTISSALRAAKTRKPSLNVEFINPFIDATRNVFRTMCEIEAVRKKLFIKEDYKMLGDVSGVMGLSGAATGSVVISLPETLACLTVAKMLGDAKPKTHLDTDVCDGVAELINMISGQAKAMLVATKYHFTISIPSVVTGPGHEIQHKKGTPNIVVLFDANGMEFAIQVALRPGDPGASQS